MTLDLDRFAHALDRLPEGYREGTFANRRYAVTLRRSADGRRRWLWAEELGGADRVSANIYRLGKAELRLLPCEMPAEKVTEFVLGFRADPPAPADHDPLATR